MSRRSAKALIILLVVAGLGQPFSSLVGQWRGTYHSMPQLLLGDGSYPERVNAFTLTLRSQGTQIVGRFEPLGDGVAAAQDIRNYGRFGERQCFDLAASDGLDMRWCVTVRGSTMQGMWNSGPQGGPALGGLGTGVRLFEVKARRLK